jgi:hypothetical protein
LKVVLAPTAPSYTVADAKQGKVQFSATLTNVGAVAWIVAHPFEAEARAMVGLHSLTDDLGWKAVFDIRHMWLPVEIVLARAPGSCR